MKILFLFWHGLGDNILATPAIKAYKKANPDHYIGWAMLRRFKSAQLWNPYIDKYHWVSDAWNDFENYKEGIENVIAEAEVIKYNYSYDKIIVIDHKSSGKHKILRTADEMGISLAMYSFKTEFYFQYPKWQQHGQFWFFHGRTGVEGKDWTMKDTKVAHLQSQWYDANLNKPIWYGAEFLMSATQIYVVDSVFFHVACALGIKPTLSYFARGKSTFDIVKPLHMDVSDTVIYEL